MDISTVQVGLARGNVPGADFRHGDFSELVFPKGSFDAVLALYSIFHLPRADHPQLYGRIHEWLSPGGLFLAALVAGDGRAS